MPRDDMTAGQACRPLLGDLLASHLARPGILLASP